MTTYEISENSAGLAIELAGVGEQEGQLLAAFAQCQQGQCSCPTDEYQKVESMDVAAGEGEILIQLRPKEGTSFDISQLTACLDYTVGQQVRLPTPNPSTRAGGSTDNRTTTRAGIGSTWPRASTKEWSSREMSVCPLQLTAEPRLPKISTPSHAAERELGDPRRRALISAAAACRVCDDTAVQREMVAVPISADRSPRIACENDALGGHRR